jgi:hypothetical protein
VSRPIRDVTGKQYGPYTALRYVELKAGKAVWEFRCECGSLVQKRLDVVERAAVQACYCNRTWQSARGNRDDAGARRPMAVGRFYCEADRRHGR